MHVLHCALMLIAPAVSGPADTDSAAGASFLFKSPEFKSPETRDGALNMPYHGVGTVSVLDDGHLVLHIMETLTRQTSLGEREERLSTKEVLYFSLDPTTVKLIHAPNRHWGLDQDGAQLAKWRLRPSEVTSMRFARLPDRPGREKNDQAKQSLVDITGVLTLDFNPQTGVHTLVVVDPQTGQRFAAGFRATAAPDEEVVEQQAPLDETQVQTTTCSANCTHGNCSASCDFPKMAECYCDSEGYAHCNCVAKPKKIETVPVEVE